MKVKNIVFSGVMAAILGATGAHAADPIQLISKTYADNNLQSKLTQTDNAGDNVTISADGKIGVDLTNYATTGAVDTAINNAVTSDTGVIKTAIDGVQADVDALDEKIGELPNGTTATSIVEYVDAKTTGIATNEALGQLTTRVGTAEGEIDVLQASLAEGGATANAIAGALKAGTDAQDAVDTLNSTLTTNDTVAKANAAAVESEVDAALELKANAADVYTQSAADAKFIDTTEIQNYATDDELTAVSNVANAAATKTYVDEELEKKANASVLDSYYTKSEADSTFMDSTEVDAKIETATADMASATELAGVKTTAQQGVTDAAAAKAAADAAQADADANATAIQGKVDSIGAGKAGSYIIDFDADGKASYTQITII